MNRLSWFLYLAEVLQNIRSASGFILLFGVLFGGAGVAMMTAYSIVVDPRQKPAAKSARRWLAAVLIPAAILSAIIPSQNTMYAIAASEVGEKVVKSEAVQGMASDATKALQQWIKRQIEPEKK